jgi:hypothetical protein
VHDTLARATTELPKRPRPRVPVRAGLIGLALVPPNAYWLAIVELTRNSASPTSVSLFFNAVFSLLLLALTNAALRRLAPRWALDGPELIFAYILVTLGSAMAGIDMFCCLPPMLAYPTQYATPENGWAESMLPILPRQLMVTDAAVVRGYWQGNSSVWAPGVIEAWRGPIAWWMLFTLALVVLYVAMTVLFSPRWMESERLTYPISQLPAQIALAPRRLVIEPLFLVGLALPLAIDALNGMHQLKPAWPLIPVKCNAIPAFQIGSQIIDRPWNAIGGVSLSFYPFAIGLGMLLPTRLSFSCWAFFLLIKFQHVAVNQAGSWTTEGLPYTREQSVGAFLGLIAFAGFLARRYLASFLRDAVRGDPAGTRPLAPRTTLLLGLGAFGLLLGFSVWAGMTWSFALGFFGLYAALCLSFTRIRAEMGVPTHELHMVGPGQCLMRWFGSRAAGPGNLAVSTVYFWFNRAYRSHPMPHLAEGLKLCERAGLSQRGLLGWSVAAMMLGGLSSVASVLAVYYRDGAAGKWGPFYHSVWIAQVPYGELATVLHDPTKAHPAMIVASLVGAIVAFGAMAAHTFVPWWPLHPVGYAVSNAWAMDNMWFSILVAWCAKAIAERYAGGGTIRRLAFFAYGLVLGDFVGGSLWSLYGTHKGIVAYAIWP